MTEEQIIALLAAWFQQTLREDDIVLTGELSKRLAQRFLLTIHPALDLLVKEMEKV